VLVYHVLDHRDQRALERFCSLLTEQPRQHRRLRRRLPRLRDTPRPLLPPLVITTGGARTREPAAASRAGPAAYRRSCRGRNPRRQVRDEILELGELDLALFREFGMDGRIIHASLAKAAGWSESLMDQPRESGTLFYDLELDMPAFGYHAQTWLWLRCRHQSSPRPEKRSAGPPRWPAQRPRPR
jgi:hypothetical protein